MSLRTQKVNKLLKQEVSQLLLQELDFGNALVTITDVSVSGNLRLAKIKITVLPNQQTEFVLNRLSKNIYHLQQIINHRLKMRPVPKLEFIVDKETIKAQRVEDILHQMHQK
jgi:ribosome-binding factor A